MLKKSLKKKFEIKKTTRNTKVVLRKDDVKLHFGFCYRNIFQGYLMIGYCQVSIFQDQEVVIIEASPFLHSGIWSFYFSLVPDYRLRN